MIKLYKNFNAIFHALLFLKGLKKTKNVIAIIF